jgi:threonine dehydratase
VSSSHVFACRGCGARLPAEALLAAAMHCPNASDASVDHVLEPLTPDVLASTDAGRLTREDVREPNPFVRYRRRFASWALGGGGLEADEAFVRAVESLDRAVAAVDGRGFRVTPFERHPRLGDALGFVAPGGVWVKDETGNVSGSHKARHLMGIMLFLEMLHRLDPAGRVTIPPLAIASCGNAALAAAVVARAAKRPLRVYVPASASSAVVDRLRVLEAEMVFCERRPGEPGDPCYLRFREAIAAGALAFCCQGPDNALTIEGGETIAWEMLDQLGGEWLDRVFVQVGGGALASAVSQAFLTASRADQASLPRLHAVQTASAFPLARAWAIVALCTLDTLLLGTVGFDANVPGEIRAAGENHIHAALRALADARGDDEASVERAMRVDHHVLQACADGLRSEHAAAAARHALAEVVGHRSAVMWPWEHEPHSLAHGILDDETYDWRGVVDGMLASGGWPIIVPETQIERANHVGREATGIDVDHTGSAGLAGLMALVDIAPSSGSRTPIVLPTERVAVIFSGIRRS